MTILKNFQIVSSILITSPSQPLILFCFYEVFFSRNSIQTESHSMETLFWILSPGGVEETPGIIQSMEFSRPEYCSGKPLPSPGIFPTQGSNPGLPHCSRILYQLSHKGRLSFTWHNVFELHLCCSIYQYLVLLNC